MTQKAWRAMSKATSELADAMYRDWRTEPLEMNVPPAVDDAVRKLIPQERWRPKVLILNRASTPKNVIDSKPEATCDGCGELCWVAPSSRAAMAESTIICMRCVERAAGWEP